MLQTLINWLRDNKELIAILFGSGIIGAFLKSAWPSITYFIAGQSNQRALSEIEKRYKQTKTYQSNSQIRQECYAILDLCKDSIYRSKKNDGLNKRYGLRKQYDEALRWEELAKSRLRVNVRIYILISARNNYELVASFLLRQNPLQNLFQFELGYLADRPEAIDLIKAIPLEKGRANFIENCERIIDAFEKINPLLGNEEPVKIIITDAPLPGNYYLWGHYVIDTDNYQYRHESTKFWVISVAKLDKILPEIPLEFFALRVVQRACVLSVLPPAEPNRFTHKSTTVGCLFDVMRGLSDARYLIEIGYICEKCLGDIMLEATELPVGHRGDFLHNLQTWLKDTRPIK